MQYRKIEPGTKLNQVLMQDLIQFSDVLSTNPEHTDLTSIGVSKVDRLRLLRDVLGDEQLAQFSPGTLKCACDGMYFLSPREVKEIDELARLVADSTIPLSRLGRMSTFAKIVRGYRK